MSSSSYELTSSKETLKWVLNLWTKQPSKTLLFFLEHPVLTSITFSFSESSVQPSEH